MVDCVVLTAHGRTSTTTLPYDAMDAKGWHRRARIVYDAPPSLVATYLPLASKVFATQYRGDAEAVASSVVAVGDLGLGFALDEARLPIISVETVALMQLTETAGSPEFTPCWLSHLASTWTSGQCLFMHNGATGWRGCVSEHRLWSAYLLRHGEAIKTPYPKPTVRGWVPDAVLDDLIECVGAATVDRVATTISDLGFDGAPDLVLWTRSSGQLWLVEVKSASDRLRDTQSQMLKELSRLDHVTCSVCCPEAARKRMLATMMADESTDEE